MLGEDPVTEVLLGEILEVKTCLAVPKLALDPVEDVSLSMEGLEITGVDNLAVGGFLEL